MHGTLYLFKLLFTAGQEISQFCGAWKFIIEFTKVPLPPLDPILFACLLLSVHVILFGIVHPEICLRNIAFPSQVGENICRVL
jgi:hypothetical protein